MRVRVTVDDREPTGVVDCVRTHPDAESVDVRRLQAGDIVIGAVAVERKTPSDYVRSAIGSGGTRLADQLRKLTAAVDHPYLLVEGDLPAMEAATGLDAAAVRGSVASVVARTGVPVIPCSDRERLVDLAVRLGRKHVETPSPDPLMGSSVTGLDEPTAKRMYGCIDGIGPQLAETLYEAFPTVAALVDANPESLRSIEGIGDERARRIRETLHSTEL